MRCLMCEQEISEEHAQGRECFCSEECKNVYRHIYGKEELREIILEPA